MNIRTLPAPWGITIVRVMAGLILVVAAFEKFNGGGFDGFTKATTGMGLPLPQFWGVFIPLLELIGGALLLVGLGARWVALLFVAEFLVTTFALKAQRQPPFGGWDSLRIDLMLLAASIMLVLVGPGAFALESLLFGSRGRQGSTATAGQSGGLALGR
jgi:putative oxidoreductase